MGLAMFLSLNGEAWIVGYSTCCTNAIVIWNTLGDVFCGGVNVKSLQVVILMVDFSS